MSEHWTRRVTITAKNQADGATAEILQGLVRRILEEPMTPLWEAKIIQAHLEAYSIPVDGDPTFRVTVIEDPDDGRLALHQPHADCARTWPHADCVLGLSAPFRAEIVAHRRATAKEPQIP
jgi:hypothetical protein